MQPIMSFKIKSVWPFFAGFKSTWLVIKTALFGMTLSLTLASTAVANETVPFKNIAMLAEPNDLFFTEAGFYYVLDREQNLAWLLDEAGTFQGLVAFIRHDGVVRVIRDGETYFDFNENDPVSSALYSGLTEDRLPDTRSVFQQIAGSRLAEPLGDVLPAGALFTSSFTVELPDGDLRTWWPDADALGVFVRDEGTQDMWFFLMAELAPALDLSWENSDE